MRAPAARACTAVRPADFVPPPAAWRFPATGPSATVQSCLLIAAARVASCMRAHCGMQICPSANKVARIRVGSTGQRWEELALLPVRLPASVEHQGAQPGSRTRVAARCSIPGWCCRRAPMRAVVVVPCSRAKSLSTRCRKSPAPRSRAIMPATCAHRRPIHAAVAPHAHRPPLSDCPRRGARGARGLSAPVVPP